MLAIEAWSARIEATALGGRRPCEMEMLTPPFWITRPSEMTQDVPVLSELGRCHESCRKTAGLVEGTGTAMVALSDEEKADVMEER